MKTIFISSTFRDMHFERDAIQETVMPRINEAARKYGQSVSFCDLRWGINTDDLETEAGSRKVLDVCLDEIDRCQPPMVVILGDRYGWIPDGALIQTAAERKQIQLNSLRKSVTALEIEYGALSNSSRAENTLFYFREFEGVWPEGFEEEDAEHAALLKELKDRIRSLTGGKIRNYKVRWEDGRLVGVHTFADMLTQDLEGMLLPQWKSFGKMNPHRREMYTHWTFIREKAAMFRARKGAAATLLKEIRSGKDPLILQGTSGLGKSTLLAYMATELESDHQVIPIICGLTQKSNTAMDILQIIVYSLEELLGTDHLAQFQDANQKDQKLSTKQWINRLNALCNECSAAKKRVAILVDAADQLLEDTLRKKLIFIPDGVSQYVRFVMTCLPDLPLQGRPCKMLQPIVEAEKRLIIAGMLEEKKRELSTPVIQAILAKPASDTPLYLSLLVQRLLMMNKEDFDAIRKLGEGMSAITEYQKQLVAACPNELSNMSVELLRVTGQRINGPMVASVAQLIGITRYGLRQQDLAALLPDTFNALDFAHFIAYMSDCFLLRSDGRYDFSHKSIRAGFRALARQQSALHSKLYDYFSSLPEDDDIRIQERGYHCVRIQDGETLRKTIHWAYKNKKKPERPPLSTALVHFCMERDAHIHWFRDLLLPTGNSDEDFSMVRFTSYWLLSDFQDTAVDPRKIEILYMGNHTLAQHVHKQLNTELSGSVLADAIEKHAAYCHRKKDTNSRQQALELRKEVVALTEGLLEVYHTADARIDLADACRMLAWSYECLPKDAGMEEALRYYSKALSLRQEIDRENSTQKTKRTLATAYDDIANLYNSITFTALNAAERTLPMALQPVCHKQHREYAAELYGKALELRKKLVEEDPSIQNRRSLTFSYRSLAELHENQPEVGQRELMIGYLQQEEQILQELYTEDRQISRAGDLAGCLEKQGSAWFSSGKRKELPKAFDKYHAAVKLRQTVYTALPTKPNRLSLANARLRRACILYHAGTPRYLKEALEELKDIRKVFLACCSDNTDYQLQNCLFYLTATAEKLGLTPSAEWGDITALPFHAQSYTYAELLEILDYMEDDYVDMIPVNMIALFRTYALPGYRKHLDPNVPLEEQDTAKKTASLLAMLMMSVWSTSLAEREELEALFLENERKHQESLGAQS